MRIEVLEESIDLVEYARIPIAFEVKRVLDVTGNGDEGFDLTERPLENAPYVKNYDAIPGGGPEQWPQRFDLANWGFLAARIGGQTVGVAAVAHNTPDLEVLEGRSDLAVLWDIRVTPEARRQGVGSALFESAETWARARGCLRLKVETQSINVPACRFYAKHGCVLRAVQPDAYPALPHEIQLLWYKDLASTAHAARTPPDAAPRLTNSSSPKNKHATRRRTSRVPILGSNLASDGMHAIGSASVGW